MKTKLLTAILSFALSFTGFAGEEEKFDLDRKAILAMTGEFAVHFSFRETLALQPGYVAKPDEYTEDAHELVLVAEDAGRRIRLQHLLVADGHVIKHWAQIWTYEDTRLCEFQGDNSWKSRELALDAARGSWSQQVTQVDDSPRYESWGKWDHSGGVSSWTSHETWRPLPRREHTKRKDYEVLAGTNRHVITPEGWAHEQDNTKTILREGTPQALAREFGLNTYRRVTDFDFAPARVFWEKDSGFWNTVVGVWDETQVELPQFRIVDVPDLPSLGKAINEVRKQSAADSKSAIRQVLAVRLQHDTNGTK